MKTLFSYGHSSIPNKDHDMGLTIGKANDTIREYQEFRHSLILSNYPKELLSPNCDYKNLINKKSILKDEVKQNPMKSIKKKIYTIMLPAIDSKNKKKVEENSENLLNKTDRILNNKIKDTFTNEDTNDKHFKLKSQKSKSRFRILNLKSESMDTTSSSKNVFPKNVEEKKSKSNQLLLKVDINQTELKYIPKKTVCLDVITNIDRKFHKIEKEIESSNQNIKKLIKKYDKKKEEIPYEQQFLIEENINYNRDVFIYHRDSKFEKRAFISSLNKNNIYEQSEFIGNTNSESIYKFRNIVFEKYGKGFINDPNILRRGLSKN